MRNRTCLKAGIYFSHYECFGHVSRVIAISEVFKKRFPKGGLFFLQAGLEQNESEIGEFGKVYQLPGPFLSRQNFNKAISLSEINVAKRSQKCLEIITRERPDLFITEFFPIGREESRFELIPALAKVCSQGARLWSVAGYPLLTGTEHQWRTSILKLYNKILIFSPSCEKDMIASLLPSKRDRDAYLDFFKRNSSKIKFVGYMLPKQQIVKDDRNVGVDSVVPKDVCHVTVVRGGGAYYSKMIAQAIRASELLGKEYYFTVIAGPSTTHEEWSLFTSLSRGKKFDNLALFKAVANYEQLLEQSDICVAVASYHTSVMLLKHRKKSVIVPFEGKGSMTFYEQTARAKLLQEVIGAKIISIHDLSAVRLAKALRQSAWKIKPSSIRIPEGWFGGREYLNNLLADF